ncbi:hypothetical protein B296_00042999 [Ensete ventricosum]|uniref:Uncharacterized protein n=1 Tax=Ensete ventricosum TaxID=4639 RepID=A0A426YHL2_ENSVE|nr:hypothetical protein B296_00042999 [Ensete ventricosum]
MGAMDFGTWSQGMQYRSVPPVSGGMVSVRQLTGMRIARYRVVSSIGARLGGRKKKREQINLESDVALRPRAISSPLAGRRNVSPCGEKKRLPVWGEGTMR